MTLALRYLRPKRTFVSVITLISIIGVMLGVAVLIIVLSVMSGFDQQWREKVLGFSAHLRVTNARGKINNFAEIRQKALTNVRVKGAAPYIVGQVMLEAHPTEGGEPIIIAPFIRGVDTSLESTVTVLPQSVKAGKFDLRGNRIVIGSALARSIGVSPGDAISLYSPRDLRKMKDARDKKDQEAVLPEDYTVTGIFDVGHYEFNSSFVLVSLANAQDLFDLDDSVQGLMVMLRNPYEAVAARDELEKLLGPDYHIMTWMEENSTFLEALMVEKNMMFYLLFFIMIVAAFGITSALITFVVQKTREIGMLKALGATNGQVMWVFLSQSLIVGVLGVACGTGLGLLAVFYRNEFLRLMRGVTGMELFPAKIYAFSELPAVVISSDLTIICGGSLVICILAGLLPAWNASRLKPVEALRHE